MSRSPSTARPLCLALTAMLAAGTGCANEAEDPGDGGASFGDEPMDPPPEDEDEEQEQGGACSITYQNDIYRGGEVTLYYVFLFPTGSDDPGPDLLGSEGVLLYGYQLEVTDVPPGTYDTIVVDEDDYFYVATEIECDANDWNWRITAADVAGQLD